MLRPVRTLAPLAALALFAVSCGEPPRRTPTGDAGTTTAPAPTAGTPSAGAPTGAMPPGHGGAGMVEGEPIDLSGSVRLTGSFSTPPENATVFVSLKPRGTQMPLLSKRLDFAGVEPTEDGALVLPFHVTGADAMGTTTVLTSAQLPPEYDLEALFDPTGGLTDPTVLVRRRIELDGHALDGLEISFEE